MDALWGMGSAILEFMADNNYSSKVVRLGIPDTYIHHGTQKNCTKKQDLTQMQ